MSFLEDKLVKIAEAKAMGLDEIAVAQSAGIDINTLKMYEQSIKSAVEEAKLKGINTVLPISESVGISTLALQLFCSSYNISLPSELGLKSSYRPITGKDRIDELKRLVLEEGVNYVSDLRERTGWSYDTIRKYAGLADLGVKTKRKQDISSHRTRIIREIKGAVQKGINSFSGIHKKAGISIPAIEKYAPEAGVELIPKRKYSSVNDILEKLRGASIDGVNTVTDLSSKTGLAYETIKKYAPLLDIELKSGRRMARANRKKYVQKDRLIRMGLSIGVIADKLGTTRENIRQYILRTGQYEKWSKSRVYYKNAKRIRREENRENSSELIGGLMGSVIERKLDEIPKDERRPYELAVKTALNHRAYSYESLLSLFKAYFGAKDRGESISISGLERASGIFFIVVGRLLHEANLSTLIRPNMRIRKILSLEQETSIKNATKLPLSATDVAYFLKINSPFSVSSRFKMMGHSVKLDKAKLGSVKLDYHKIPFYLTYRKASEIYEAKDARFSITEIAELTDRNVDFVKDVLSRREKYQPKIMRVLRMLYPDREIKKPYINWKD